MADFPTVALLVGIPLILVNLYILSTGNKNVLFMSILFSSLILFGLGYIIDTGQSSQKIFEIMLIITFLAIPAYLIILAVLTIKDFINVFKHNR